MNKSFQVTEDHYAWSGLEVGKWYYIDKDSFTVGPFTTEGMAETARLRQCPTCED